MHRSVRILAAAALTVVTASACGGGNKVTMTDVGADGDVAAATPGSAIADNGMSDGMSDGMTSTVTVDSTVGNAKGGAARTGTAGKGKAGKGMAEKGMAGKGVAGKGMAGKGMAGKGMAGNDMGHNGMTHPSGDMVPFGMSLKKAMAAGLGTDGAPVVSVVGADGACRISPKQVPAGSVWFRFTNAAKGTGELYLETAKAKKLIHIDDIRPGRGGAFSYSVRKGTYLLACSTAGSAGELRAQLTVTAAIR